MRSEFIKEYLHFTSKERKGSIYILCLVFVIIFLPFFFSYFTKKINYNHQQFEKEIAQLRVQQTDSSQRKNYYAVNDNEYSNDYSLPAGKKYVDTKAEVFLFDPNTATTSEWKRLGVRDKTIETLQKYLSKGGKFYKPEDIKKIWGLRPADVQRLLPYVSIKSAAKEYVVYDKKIYPQTQPVYSPRKVQAVDINLADTSAYIALPGIGSKLSQRIIAFRTKLGGFYSVNQVAETFLLPDSTFQKIRPYLMIGNAAVKQININSATVEEMKVHPYLRYNLANAIFQYRQQHGNFISVEGIKKIMLISEEVFIKVSPYLTIE